MRAFFRRAVPALACGLAAALTGCGGVTGSDKSSHIRTADFATNAGTTNILVNNGAAYGDQTYGNVSPPLYIKGDQSSSFSYTTSVSQPSGATYNTSNYNLSNDHSYTAYLIGRADVTVSTSSTTTTDPRFLQVVVADDSHSPPSGQAAISILHGAPDAGPVDVLINGQKVLTNQAYAAFSNYQNVPAGNVTVQVNATGSTKALIGPTTFNLSAGAGATIVAAELTTTPTYELHQVNDQ